MIVYSPVRKRTWKPSVSSFFFIAFTTALCFSDVNAFLELEAEPATSNPTITFEQCISAMKVADVSNDEDLSREEYVKFIQLLDMNDGHSNITTFDQLEEPLRSNFYNYAADDEYMIVLGIRMTAPDEADTNVLKEICNSTEELLTEKLPMKQNQNIFTDTGEGSTGVSITAVDSPQEDVETELISVCPEIATYAGDCSLFEPGLQCGFGIECCDFPDDDGNCGDNAINKCGNSTECVCQNNTWLCKSTEFCLLTLCDGDNPVSPNTATESLETVSPDTTTESLETVSPNATTENFPTETGSPNNDAEANGKGKRMTVTTEFTILRNRMVDENGRTMISNGFKQFIADFIIKVADSERVRKRSLVRRGDGFQNHRKLKVLVDASVADTTLKPCPKFANTTANFCYIVTGMFDILVFNENADYALEEYKDTTANLMDQGFLQKSLDKIHPDSAITILPEKEAVAILETQVVPISAEFLVLSNTSEKLGEEEKALLSQAFQNIVHKVVEKLNGVIPGEEISNATGMETGLNNTESEEATNNTEIMEVPTESTPSEYMDKKWNNLPFMVQEAAEFLHYNETTWDEYRGPNLIKTPYANLTETEKTSVKVLGYNQKTWDGAYYWNNIVYDELPPYFRQSADALGYNQTTWDSGKNSPTTLQEWNFLDISEQSAAIEFGFTEKKWNINSDIPLRVDRVPNLEIENTTEQPGLDGTAIAESNGTVAESNEDGGSIVPGGDEGIEGDEQLGESASTVGESNSTVGESINNETATPVENSVGRLLMERQEVSARKMKRRLTVTLEPRTVGVNNFAPCPVNAADGSCSSGFGTYKVTVTDGEDPQEVQDLYTNATLSEIENGAFQDEIDAINPNSGLVVKPLPEGSDMDQPTLPTEPLTPRTVAPTLKLTPPTTEQEIQQGRSGLVYHWFWLIVAMLIGILIGVLLSFLVRLCLKRKKEKKDLYDPENPYHANDNDRGKHVLLKNEDESEKMRGADIRPNNSDFETINPESFHDETDLDDDKETIAERRDRYKGIIKPILQEYFPEKLDELEKELKSSEGHEKDVLLNYENDALKEQKKRYYDTVTELIERYFPNETLQVDSIMKEWDGREEKLIAALKYKARGIREKMKNGGELSEGDVGLADLEKIAEQQGYDIDDRDDSFNQELNQGIAHKRALADDSESNKGISLVDKFLDESDSDKEDMSPQTEAMRNEITDIVQKDHPEWVDDLDKMMSEYRGRESELLNAVKMKSEEKQREKYRVKVEKLLEQHYPEKLREIDEMMDEYEGREDELIKTLELRGEATGSLNDDRSTGSNSSSDFD